MINADNSIPTLCELIIHEKPSDDKEYFSVSLRIASDDIQLGQEDCEISFHRVRISINSSGYEISERLGDPIVNNIVHGNKEFKNSHSHSRKNYSTIGGKIDKMATGAIASIRRSKSELSSDTNSAGFQEDAAHFRVRAKPNNDWDVQEIDGIPLNATYLDGSSPLCRMTELIGSNQFVIDLQIVCRERDINIDCLTGKWSGADVFGESKKDKLLKIFTAKTLYEKIDIYDQYKGWLPLSRFYSEKDL